ncbi:hypothetical protein CEUSTIGMA_g2059.t1 [Chlamydomonas eustigma]|uniref:Uncharacterized protein n=1 Tax=Chlamydomonas eustigma TaxID=1157962 RepID=A0A250WUW7_9CHLO|nr:hypothetical protein CEUSTIGMA_g2059.t1 [Chlamydomonas eustigma]|eukprot:GAX74611.1 hypothetical protein CEUSTIGMA_g2059.t1 [Chlamydomonas eustigma]
MGAAYWRYNINHIGVYDVGAQLDHIHETKCSELLGIIDAAKFRRKSAQVHGQGKTAAGKGVNQPDHAAAVAAAVTAADVSPSLQGISRPVGQMITKGKAAWSSLNASPCVGDSEGKPSRSTPRWWMTRSLMPGDDNLEVMQPCTAHQPPSSTVAPADHLISLLGEDRSNDMPSCQEKCDSGMNPSSTDCRERAAGGIGGDSCCRPKLHQQHRGWWSSFRWRLPLPRLGQNGGRMTGPHPVDDAAEWGSNTGHVGAQEVPQSQEVEEIDGEERTFEHFHSAQSEDLSSTQALSEGDVLGIMSTPQKHEEQQLQACKALPTEMGSEHEEHTFVERLKQPVIAAEEPYRLRAVGHSLGGVNMLMHCIVRRNSAGYGSVKSSAGHETAVGVRAPSLSTSSTHVHRLILMSPAGFHVQMPPVSEITIDCNPALLHPFYACMQAGCIVQPELKIGRNL